MKRIAILVRHLVGALAADGTQLLPYEFNYVGQMGNATIRGNRVIVWYRGELMIFAADGTQIY